MLTLGIVLIVYCVKRGAGNNRVANNSAEQIQQGVTARKTLTWVSKPGGMFMIVIAWHFRKLQSHPMNATGNSGEPSATRS